MSDALLPARTFREAYNTTSCWSGRLICFASSLGRIPMAFCRGGIDSGGSPPIIAEPLGAVI
jgi:hypothetical protein